MDYIKTSITFEDFAIKLINDLGPELVGKITLKQLHDFLECFSFSGQIEQIMYTQSQIKEKLKMEENKKYEFISLKEIYDGLNSSFSKIISGDEDHAAFILGYLMGKISAQLIVNKNKECDLTNKPDSECNDK